MEGSPETELHAAAWSGDAEWVRDLLAAGADVDVRDSIGETPLFGASGHDRDEAVALLLDAGATPGLASYSGYTPLHWAAQNGGPAVVRALLAAGADAKQTSPTGSALHLAAAAGSLEVVSLLVDAGAPTDALDQEGRNPIDAAHERGEGEVVAFLKRVGPPIASQRNRK